MKLLLAAQSSEEGIEAVTQELQQNLGVIYERNQQYTTFELEDESALDPEFDREGLQALKAKHGV